MVYNEKNIQDSLKKIQNEISIVLDMARQTSQLPSKQPFYQTFKL